MYIPQGRPTVKQKRDRFIHSITVSLTHFLLASVSSLDTFCVLNVVMFVAVVPAAIEVCLSLVAIFNINTCTAVCLFFHSSPPGNWPCQNGLRSETGYKERIAEMMSVSLSGTEQFGPRIAWRHEVAWARSWNTIESIGGRLSFDFFGVDGSTLIGEPSLVGVTT